MEEDHIYTVLLAAVGAVTLFLLFVDTLWNIVLSARIILSPYLLPYEEESLTKKYGFWALVTGCTDGIGKEYAKELAKKGFNLVLVSRSEDKLLKTAKEIEYETKIKTVIVVADFTKGPEAIEHIRKSTEAMEIGVLVNNVGMQYTYPMYVGEVPEQELWNIINVNVGAVTMMSRIFIEGMKKRRKGAIVNISSGSELQPLPLMTVYGATKVYVKNFTRALKYEYAKYGLTIQHVSPMFINTKMNDFSTRLRTTSFFIPDAETFAKYSVNTIGKLDHTTGYWSHGIQYFLTTLAPEWLRTLIGAELNKSLRNDYFKINGDR